MRLLSEIRNYMGNYHLKSGVYHYYRNEFGQAVEFLDKAWADESLSEGDRRNVRSYLTRALKGRGVKLAADGELEGGIAELRRALEIDDRYPDIHFNLAELLRCADRLEEAADSYRRAVDCHPGYLEAKIALGHCLIDAGRAEEAAEALEQAMELKLDAIRTPFAEGRKLLESGEVDEARQSFHEAFQAAPRLTRSHLDRALEALRQDDCEQALDWLDRALALSPKYPDLHNFRGIALCELERYDEAIESFGRSIELSPEHLVPRLNRAFAYLRADRTREGELHLREILDRHPGDPVAGAKLEEIKAARLPEKPGVGSRT